MCAMSRLQSDFVDDFVQHVLGGAALVWVAASVGCGGATVSTDQTNPGGGVGNGGAASGAAGGSSGNAGAASSSGAGGTGPSPIDCEVDPDDDDQDRDGFRRPNDCDDFQNRVNPGAFDIPGNGVDDDCDGTIDNGDGVACDDANDVIPMDTTDPVAMLRAMGLCKTTLLDGAPERPWGVGAAQLWGLSNSWGGKRSHLQHGVHSEFGKLFQPLQGRSMLVLSNLRARTGAQPGGSNGYPDLEPSSGEPMPNGFPENDAVCLAADDYDVGNGVAWNPISIRAKLRVPTNAAKLRWSVRAVVVSPLIQSVCRGYNSFFGVLVGGTSIAQPTTLNVGTLPDGQLFSLDHLPFTFCDPTSFTLPGRTYEYTCPDGPVDSSSRGWTAAATRWIEQEADVVPGQALLFTPILWGEGDLGGAPLAVMIDDAHWVATEDSAPICP
jgi:hypothetical protein